MRSATKGNRKQRVVHEDGAPPRTRRALLLAMIVMAACSPIAAVGGGYDGIIVCGPCGEGCPGPPRYDDFYFKHCARTPEEKAEAAKRQKEQEAKAAAQQAEKQRKDALVAAEVSRLGNHREAEARRLVELRERAQAAMPKPVAPPAPPPKPSCREKPIKVTGHSSQNVTGLLFQGWKTKAEASSQARGQLGHWCQQMTGAGGFGAITEACRQDNGGRWECETSTTCSTPQKICAGQQ
jgi:hypothetical protein